MISSVYYEREKFEEHYNSIERRLVRLEEVVPRPNILRPPPRKEDNLDKSEK